jgi:hypothetical protein
VFSRTERASGDKKGLAEDFISLHASCAYRRQTECDSDSESVTDAGKSSFAHLKNRMKSRGLFQVLLRNSTGSIFAKYIFINRDLVS